MRPDPAIRVDGLGKSFDGETVLEDISMTLPAGKITLVMGPNGVGKTILLSCLAGGLHSDCGEITVFGKSPAEARADLSFMLQDGLLVDELTGRENIEFFEALHPAATDKWHPLLDSLGFESEALDREVRDYSGGMKRKLELAITLSVDVPLYLLDEPTAALDVTTIDILHSLLSDRRRKGDTVVMSSHLPADAELADYLVFIGPAGVIASGRPKQLLDAVPRVVHVEGRTGSVAECILDRRLFETGQEHRGFLRDGADPSAVNGTGDRTGQRVHVTGPTVTDLFNYYVHIEEDDGERAETSDAGQVGEFH